MNRRVRRGVSSFEMRRAIAVLFALVFAGCGGGERPASTTSGGTAKPTQLPAVSVADLRSGERISLRTLTAADKPLLVWFWAPY